MLDLGMLYFNSDPRLAVPNVLDPFVISKNPQRLGDRRVNAAGAHLRRVFHALEIDAGHCAGLQGHQNDLSYSFFIRQTKAAPIDLRAMTAFEFSPQGGLENRIRELLKMGFQRVMFLLTTAGADKQWPPLERYYALTRKFS
jgi:hypothetical protein